MGEVLDVISYRLEKFEQMGFDYMRALILVQTKGPDGVPVYWRDVQALVDRCGLNLAYDLLVE
jgi:hypothetical protein